MILEFKHIIPYLQYDLKASFYDNAPELVIGVNVVEETIEGLDFGSAELDEGFKPILRPLSELTKEIEHNGEKLMPFEICGGILQGNDGEKQYLTDLHQFSLGKIDVRWLPYWVVDKLFEWHFDVFGLIPEGLAIKK